MEITFFSGWETLTATLPLAGKAQSMQRTKIWKVKQINNKRGGLENLMTLLKIAKNHLMKLKWKWPMVIT